MNCLTRNQYRNFDIILSALSVVFLLWFGYQRGFQNSPDSWYRGAIARSILEGHPFWVNIKQGWFYEYSAWHHDSTHEPFLPSVYALIFLFTGPKIWVASVVTCASAGAIIFPLLRLSRFLTCSGWPAVAVFMLGVFNEQNEFMRELVAGLSIPTSVLMIFLAFYALWHLLESERVGWQVLFALAMGAFYLNRADAQAASLFLFCSSLPFCWKWCARPVFWRYLKAWGMVAIIIAPWVTRKIILFGNPLFRDAYPMIWADRSYDYYDYHENGIFPSASTYFAHHSLKDFIIRNLFDGPMSLLSLFGQCLYGGATIYVLFFLCSFILLFKLPQQKRFFLLFTQLLTLGFWIVFSLSTFNERRHLLTLFFLFTTNLFFGGAFLLRQLLVTGGLEKAAKVSPGICIIIAVIIHWPFIYTFREKQIKLAYTTADELADNNPTYRLLTQRVKPNEILLAPFSEAQRYAFLTGLGIVEMPVNLKRLKDPAAFFRKYQIKYALVDVSNILPREMIEKVEGLGQSVLFTIRLESDPDSKTKAGELGTQSQPAAVASIDASVGAYWDGFHGSQMETSISNNDVKAYSAHGPITDTENLKALNESKVLVLGYRGDANQFSAEEIEQVKRFVDRGGSAIIACPAWVWIAYAQGTLETLPCNQLARLYGAIISAESAGEPYVASLDFLGIEQKRVGEGSSMSTLIALDGIPFLTGSDGKVVGVRIDTEASRAIIVGHDFFLSKQFLSGGEGAAIFSRSLNWLERRQ